MVSRVGGAGSIPPPDKSHQVAAALKAALQGYINLCAALNNAQSLDAFAKATADLATLAKEAQTC